MLIDKENLELYNKSTRKLGKGGIVNKEQILESAKRNKQRGSEYENRELDNGYLWGNFVAYLIIFLMMIMEYFMNGSVNMGVITVGLTMLAVQTLYQAIKIRKKMYFIMGIIVCVLAISFLINYFSTVIFA